MKKKSTKLLLFLLFLLAIILRLLYFNKITFGYDQARDAFQAIEIWTTDHFKILGPRTDLPALYHGPLYWYLISPFYYFTQGNIWAVKLFLILLNSIGVFLVYRLTYQLFKKNSIALLSSFFYAISFELTQYARWMSNPSPAVITSLISFWSLWRLINNQKWSLPLLLISWGLSVQFEFFMVYQIVAFVLIWMAINGKRIPKVSRAEAVVSIVGLLASLSCFWISEIKFNFQGTKSLLSFFKTQHLFDKSFTVLLTRYLDRFSSIFFLNLWGINLFLAGLGGISTIYLTSKIIQKNNRQKNQLIFLLGWVLSPIILHFFTGGSGSFVNLGAGTGAIILSSWLISRLTRNNQWLLVLLIAVILAGNLNLILTQNKNGEVLFSVQEKMLLGDELKAIDWIYREAGGEPFRLNTITNPLFINTTWTYLFNWYGKRKYGYMPIWWGEKQVNVFGDNIIFSPETKTNLHFLIIEPGPGIPSEYITAIQELENKRSKVIEKKQLGNFIVEKRKITHHQIFTSQDVFWWLKTPHPSNLNQL